MSGRIIGYGGMALPRQFKIYDGILMALSWHFVYNYLFFQLLAEDSFINGNVS